MKRSLPYFIIAVIAIAIVFIHPLAVYGADDFTLTPDGYKVFRYGFPFRIVDCAAHLPIHMATWKVVVSFIGNFTVFFLCGMLIMHAVRRNRLSHARLIPA